MVNTQKLKGKIVETGYSQENIAELLDIDRSTFYRKMKDNGKKFDIEEVNKLIGILSLSDQEVFNIFFSN